MTIEGYKVGDRVIYGERTPVGFCAGRFRTPLKGMRGVIENIGEIQTSNGMECYYEIRVTNRDNVNIIGDLGKFIELDKEYYYGY